MTVRAITHTTAISHTFDVLYFTSSTLGHRLIWRTKRLTMGLMSLGSAMGQTMSIITLGWWLIRAEFVSDSNARGLGKVCGQMALPGEQRCYVQDAGQKLTL